MTSDDYERFVQILQNLATVYGKKLDDEQIKFYWNALKDRPLADIEARAEKYGQKGRFFPKPRDIRPNEAYTEVVEESAESKKRFEQLNRESEVVWNERLRVDPLRTKLQLAAALAARYSLESDQGSVILAEKREWLRGRRLELLREAIGAGRPEIALQDLHLWTDLLMSEGGYKVIDHLADRATILGREPFLARSHFHAKPVKQVISEAA